MFRPIRKVKNAISPEAGKQLLQEGRYGVLSVHGEDGYPYGLPVNYFYDETEGKIYFHGARVGHKVDAIKADDRVCFTVVGKEEVRDLDWAPYAKSVIIFGRCHLVTDQEACIRLVRRLGAKFYPDMEKVDAEVAESGRAVQMFELTIEHMSAKGVQEI